MMHAEMTLFGILVFLVMVCSFFSLAETSMMSLNRYRLRHLARHQDRAAKRLLKLIEVPDRLLGLILIGNTVVNVLASAVATLLAIRFWGENTVGFATVLLIFVILIFGEIAPKTVAALHPLRIALVISAPIRFLLMICYPLVWLVNMVTNGFLRLIGVKINKNTSEALNSDELRTLVHEAGAILPSMHKNMLLSLLDLEKLTVDDIMLPKGDIKGIDLTWSTQQIISHVVTSSHLTLPVYQEHIDEVKGMLRVGDVISALTHEKLTKEVILENMRPAYFIPEKTPLNTQLMNFRHEKQRLALVVDEYGDIQGLVTIEDILEEIVGEFSTSILFQVPQVELQKDGSFIVDASMNIRELNRKQGWQLPIEGPKTLSGLIIEELGMIPPVGFCLKIADYQLEILSVKERLIKRVRVKLLT
ncbi:MAG: HlyC/CorC family transporter [Gammaproteobacteria bacterium]|nr:HlyC/CorC family transporter [Gammaproteobacteria bacterium]